MRLERTVLAAAVSALTLLGCDRAQEFWLDDDPYYREGPGTPYGEDTGSVDPRWMDDLSLSCEQADTPLVLEPGLRLATAVELWVDCEVAPSQPTPMFYPDGRPMHLGPQYLRLSGRVVAGASVEADEIDGELVLTRLHDDALGLDIVATVLGQSRRIVRFEQLDPLLLDSRPAGAWDGRATDAELQWSLDLPDVGLDSCHGGEVTGQVLVTESGWVNFFGEPEYMDTGMGCDVQGRLMLTRRAEHPSGEPTDHARPSGEPTDNNPPGRPFPGSSGADAGPTVCDHADAGASGLDAGVPKPDGADGDSSCACGE